MKIAVSPRTLPQRMQIIKGSKKKKAMFLGSPRRVAFPNCSADEGAPPGERSLAGSSQRRGQNIFSRAGWPARRRAVRGQFSHYESGSV